MTLRFKSPAKFLAATVALSLALPMTSAAAAQCQAQIDAALEKHAIPQSDVKSMQVMTRSRGAKSASNSVVDAWVRLNSCSGYVMVTMTRNCRAPQIYTTGDCRVDGVPNH